MLDELDIIKKMNIFDKINTSMKIQICLKMYKFYDEKMNCFSFEVLDVNE